MPVFRRTLWALTFGVAVALPAAPAGAQAEAPVPQPSAEQGIGRDAMGQEPGPPAAETTPAPVPVAPDPWAATIDLYGFVPIRTKSTVSIKGLDATSDVSFSEVLPLIQMTASARASLEKGRLGLLTDLNYFRVGAQAARVGPRDRLTGSAELGFSQGIYDIALRYRFGDREAAIGKPGQYSIIPYAGIRIVKLALDLEASVTGNGLLGVSKEKQGDFGRTWVQPLIGTEATLFLSPRLRAFVRADLGGFGLAGAQDLSGNAQVGLGYAIGNNTDLNVSFRYLGLVYDNGAEQASGYDLSQTGVQLGLKVFF
jgi:hypothetical protein